MGFLFGQIATPPAVPCLAMETAVEDWWAVRRAVYDAANGVVYMSGVAYDGKAVIGSYNVATGERVRTVLAKLQVDEHNTPALLVEADKPPIVAYCNHGTENHFHVRRATAVRDISSWNSEQTIATSGGATYAQLYREAGTNNLVNLLRVGLTAWHVSLSEDFGETWSTPISVFTLGQQMYIATSQDESNVLHVAMYGHPTNSSCHDVYFCTIDLASGAVKKKDGTTIGNIKTGSGLPIAFTGVLEQAYTHPGGHNTRLFDINQNDEIVIADWTNDYDAVYRYVRWNGSSWESHPIVAAGQVIGYTPSIHYHAGASLDFNGNLGVVFLGREANDVWYMERWTTGDGGETWSSEVISSGELKLARPFQAVPSKGIIYTRFTSYTDYTHYEGDIYWYLGGAW